MGLLLDNRFLFGVAGTRRIFVTISLAGTFILGSRSYNLLVIIYQSGCKNNRP
jgi:hypothetical protein